MSQQQTVLQVKSNYKFSSTSGETIYESLDLYSDIPIKINKSIAEIQDIGKKNSDFSIGLSLPGSKKNNRFFENFFNVDTQSLYFNVTNRVECSVLLNDQKLFTGYMRLNKVNVQNSKIEYDVTLYSSIGDLFGSIGNGLLRDLDFLDTGFTFNHVFNLSTVVEKFSNTNFSINGEKPIPFIYPIVHNGYEYTEVSGKTIPFVSGGTADQMVGLYSSTTPISGFSSYSGFTAAGGKPYYINTPGQGIYNNQLKPALNVWSLFQLIFKQYGYKINSDFMNTPWFKTLYIYGLGSSEATKFSYKLYEIQTLPPLGLSVCFYQDDKNNVSAIPVTSKGIPVYCTKDLSVHLHYSMATDIDTIIYANTSGTTIPNPGVPFVSGYADPFEGDIIIPTLPQSQLKYFPKKIGENVLYTDGDFVDFSLAIDQNYKIIDFLSSIAKKFNLVFVPDPEVPNQIIVESYDFYMGTGNIYDWTPKLSWDKGFTVEPALNYIESTLTLTDQEDGDDGNKIFKSQNNRIYGQNITYNTTQFKSQDKKIETTFSPELIRKWDNNIGLPLGINYVSTNTTDSSNEVRWTYKGVKTKPKLMFWLGGFNPFIDTINEVYNGLYNYNSYQIYIKSSDGTNNITQNEVPVISHTMPMGLSDEVKESNGFENDSLCILFNSEETVDVGVQTYNTYTRNDSYTKFYSTRITNVYNPNTRFLSGYFDLKYSDILNLKPNDIIKINEQYFVLNKISDFNLTNRELTKVELVQFNNNPQTYPTRYFRYSYCDNPSVCYKIKTDMTNPNLQKTNFGWSIYYDYQVGSISALSGQTSGFTSTIKDVRNGTQYYIPYTMYEINETDYYNSTCDDYTCDTLMTHISTIDNGLFNLSMPTFWRSSGSTYVGTNVFENCTKFNTTKTTYNIVTGSSVYYGTTNCFPPTPTPTPTGPTPTPTGPTPTPITNCYLYTNEGMNGWYGDYQDCYGNMHYYEFVDIGFSICAINGTVVNHVGTITQTGTC